MGASLPLAAPDSGRLAFVEDVVRVNAERLYSASSASLTSSAAPSFAPEVESLVARGREREALSRCFAFHGELRTLVAECPDSREVVEPYARAVDALARKLGLAEAHRMAARRLERLAHRLTFDTLRSARRPSDRVHRRRSPRRRRRLRSPRGSPTSSPSSSDPSGRRRVRGRASRAWRRVCREALAKLRRALRAELAARDRDAAEEALR